MAQTKTNTSAWLQLSVLRLSRAHYWFVAAYAMLTIVLDAWNLIPFDGLGYRWGLAGLLLVVVTIVWYLSRVNNKPTSFYKGLVFALIIVDILVASYLVYLDRGMASKYVVLYAVPIISSAVLLSRSALFASATLCVVGYMSGVLRYYTEHPGEGYKIEMYSTVLFYSAIFLLLSALLWIVVRTKR